MATAHHSLALPNLPASQGLGTRSAVMGSSLGDSPMEIVYRQSAAFDMSALEVACGAVTAAGAGRVAWQRVSESDASGKDRLPGQMDGRAVLKMHVKPLPTAAGHRMVAVVLAATEDAPVRVVQIRAETIRFIRA